METAVLIAQCLAGDQDAIAAFVEQSYPAVFRLAVSILDDPAEAGEAAQEALWAAVSRLGQFRGEAALTTWLYTLTLNVCRGRLRKLRARQRLHELLAGMLSLEHSAPAVEETVIAHEGRRKLWAAVQALGEKQRLPVILRYYHNLPVAEIAQILEINEGTVHSRLNTARARLKAALAGSGDQPGGWNHE